MAALRDWAQVELALKSAIHISRQPLLPLMSVPSSEVPLLQEWEDSRVPVYLDFGGDGLWRMNPHSPNGRAYLCPVTKASFVKVHREGLLNEEQMTQGLEGAVAEFFDVFRRAAQAYQASRTAQTAPARPLVGFQRYMARRGRSRLL